MFLGITLMPKNEPKSVSAYHHGDLRQALLQAALAKADQDGAETISLAALARAIGVSQAAPYRHFPDRDALLAAVAEEAFKIFHANLLDAVALSTNHDSQQLICRAYVNFGLARPGLYRLMFASQILHHAASEAKFKILAQRCFQLLLKTAVPPQATKCQEHQALKIWMGLHGLVMLAQQGLIENGPVPITVDEMIDVLLT
jgi:AcrR family transcriptional regulator